MPTNIDRRRFLEQLGAGAAGAVALGATETALGFGSNDTLQVGCIGTGGRCRYLMQRLAQIPNVRITAVCDVWDQHLEEGRKLADSRATATKHYRELLERKDVDAVLIGSPDHWHVPMTIDACRAGKDVYVEKPLTHDLSEGAPVIAAQKESKAIVQVGTQQRSLPQFQKAFEILKSGALGTIYKVHLTWNRNQERWNRRRYGIDPKTVLWKEFLGNAPEQPFDEYRFRNWRWFWDFGGGIFTDLMVHFVDVAVWYLDLGEPATVASIGDHFAAKGLWETPDTVQTLQRYPEQHAQVYFEGTFVNARNAAMLEFMGTEATLYLDRGRYEVLPERRSKTPASEFSLTKNPARGADFYDDVEDGLMHLANWVECVRTRQTPNAPVEAGVRAAAAAHYANRALREGRTVGKDE
ncbi:MAG: Gfo/Idh/MocA family oxidoreductase [Planctomycetes bacterium]|nr:Gfo/Idh/MocA family oxidoreductase [Planctomycetota bacterium]